MEQFIFIKVYLSINQSTYASDQAIFSPLVMNLSEFRVFNSFSDVNVMKPHHLADFQHESLRPERSALDYTPQKIQMNIIYVDWRMNSVRMSSFSNISILLLSYKEACESYLHELNNGLPKKIDEIFSLKKTCSGWKKIFVYIIFFYSTFLYIFQALLFFFF